MPYIPHTQTDTADMLKTIGVNAIEDLFSAVPDSIFLKNDFKLPPGLSEQDVKRVVTTMANKNKTYQASFLGGGMYHHHIPAQVHHLAMRSEFYTAYTPYQPEISQGILQSIFEYQTMMTRLTALDATNASMYDGATATAEAAFMLADITQKNIILVASNVNPQYRAVLQTYCIAKGLTLQTVPFDQASGRVDINQLEVLLTDAVAGLFIQSPNFFGVVEDVKYLSGKLHAKNKLIGQIITEALSLGILTPPGDNGVDLAVGEGQSFGLPVSAGGPGFGFLATTQKYLRKLPGRIVGQTEDNQGRRAYVLTLQAREQHIRREKASSNICSNQALCALHSVIYLASLGKKLRELALLNHQHSLYFQKALIAKKWPRTFSAPFFNEFVVKTSNNAAVIQKLAEHNIAAGIDLGRLYPELKDHLLICVTELISQDDMENYENNI
ncbi:MAG: aminomethyl-transferring glycine dehydrogenase subunit GcvPA [Patescibacteria group bacterium]|jgi:glycine dehydrogenase subunit 1